MGSDAHAAPERELLPLGMAIARRDPRERILNYRPLEFARSWAHRTRG